MKAVDLFAGWGGFTVGAEQAGVDVVWAANHWKLAVDTHARNHPRTAHVCQDLRQADWSALPAYDLLLAAPACQGHSQASQPKRRKYHDTLRATAWAVVDCLEVTSPRGFVVENVLDFKRWVLYDLWHEALKRLGYNVTTQTMRASHYGVPQRRDRLFIVGTRGSMSWQLPAPNKTEMAFGPCIDWPAPGWRPLTVATENAQKRFAKGRANHGARFLSQHVTNHPGVALNEPIRTITTKDQWVVVDGDRYRPLTMREIARGMGFPESYTWVDGLRRDDVHRGLGNAVCPGVGRVIISALAGAA